jgi:Cd(II)/Pb(II)-responsive transcriptional regulator
MRIGELARHANCGIETIRYYEKAGLLPKPVRTAGNYRLYCREHAERLQFIRHCRSLDMTLGEIRTLLKFRDAPDEDCGEVNVLLEEHIAHVATRIAELKVLERQLKKLRKLCATVRSARHCRILQKLATAGGAFSERRGHVQGAHARNKNRPPERVDGKEARWKRQKYWPFSL